MMNILYWNGNNLGDLTNIYIGLMYNYIHFSPILCNQKMNCSIFMIGSVLKYCGDNNIIFGAGFKHNTDSIELKNNKLYCIRGKLTKNVFSKVSSKLMMDPGLLIRKLYIPNKVNTSKKMLIIPHINHRSFFTKDTSEYSIMDIRFSVNEYKDIINYNSSDYNKDKIVKLFNNKFDIINSYDIVLSSSLHGLVFAHAFGKKTIYFKIDDAINEPLHKYNDYYSIYNMSVTPITINKKDIPNLIYNDYVNNKSHSVDITKHESLINDAYLMLKNLLK